VLIGEMRDMETAESAIQASLTGHLVFSTLHTNDAPSAVTRLIDMGVEPFLVASTVEGVMAQRLVRTICPDCKVAFRPEIDELPIDFPTGKAIEQYLIPGLAQGPPPIPSDGERSEAPTLYKGTGCRSCRQSGYRGRTGIHELMVANDTMRELIVNRVNAGVIRHEAMKGGMKTLRQDGWRKVLAGQTTVDEVARVTAGDIVG
jgi:type II secretory ATPase GspE/PulE/Tfp pilus assembly ATPase PilB-like protein